jgi:site-specific DNA-methyltransferase (adenine-specific)
MTTMVHLGDCIEVMRTLPAESVDAIVTSPPYAMQRKATYGGIAEKDYPSWTVEWMAEAMRLLKPDGSVIINIRPHIKDGQISDYVLRTRLALREGGWVELEEMIWNKKGGAPLGSVNRPRRSWESLLWFGKHGHAWSAPKAGGVASSRVGGVSSKRTGPHIHGKQKMPEVGISRVSDVAEISTRKNENDNGLNTHAAPFPPALAEWCGKLICPDGGTILDPFSGSASTGIAAIRNGWDYIGIDAVAEYVDMSRLRLAAEEARSE